MMMLLFVSFVYAFVLLGSGNITFACVLSAANLENIWAILFFSKGPIKAPF